MPTPRRVLPHRLTLALCAALAALPVAASAQDPAPAAPAEATPGAIRTYAPDFFARFAPRNALEMLENVPGFVIRAEVVERGLGQATGNVLLNGQRLSGKSNDVLSQVQRIPAGNVVRVEILDGASLDIPGLSGQVANIVAEAGGISGAWRWRPTVRKYFADPNWARFDMSLSGAGETIDWTLGLANNSNYSAAGGGTDIYNVDGTLREQRTDEWTGENEQPQVTAQLSRKGASGSLSNLNVSIRGFDYEYLEEGRRFGNVGIPDRDRNVRSTEDGHNSELGGDHEFALGGGRMKLIGLLHVVDSSQEDTVIVDYDDTKATEGDRFSRDGVETEAIARGEYRWKHGVADWQVSGEYAFNELDSSAELAVLGLDGEFHPEPLPGSDAVVQEDRFELMGSYGRPLSEAVTLQTSLGAEYSQLAQAGGGTTREFVRPKGFVSVAWKASDALDVGLKLEHRVGQLNFYDFLASVDLNDDQASAGNPDLVPPQTTELQLDTTRKLGAWGTTSLRLYAQAIQDIVDTVPIGDDAEAPGNLDSASVLGFEWKASIELAQLGWKGAKLDTLVQMERSEVEDPLTGEKRPISNNLAELFEIALRHDIPDTTWAWGGDLGYYFYEKDYRLTEVGRFWEGPYWGTLYVEQKDWHGMTVRLTASNLLDARSKWNRTVYVDRRTGPIDFTQKTDRLIGPIFQLSVSGKF